ncbi:chorismate synthase, partial [Bacillus spizizenii]|nr:chorismate synthase [Bacillus spizizenii]
AASVVAEAAVAWEIANAVVEQFGLDQIDRIRENVENMRKLSREF